jgi:hypothetical protein
MNINNKIPQQYHSAFKRVVRKELFSIKDNWGLLAPYLHHPDVQRVLNEVMRDYCAEFPDNGKWKEGNAPWKFAFEGHWTTEIEGRAFDSEGFLEARKELYYQLYGHDADSNEEWEDQFHSEHNEEWYEIFNECFLKELPDDHSYEWYDFSGEYRTAPFIAVLLSKFLDSGCVGILRSDTHSVAVFIVKECLYYADFSNQWNNVQELENFIGREFYFIGVSDLIAKSFRTTLRRMNRWLYKHNRRMEQTIRSRLYMGRSKTL